MAGRRSALPIMNGATGVSSVRTVGQSQRQRAGTPAPHNLEAS
jgi:hypothetical protein